MKKRRRSIHVVSISARTAIERLESRRLLSALHSNTIPEGLQFHPFMLAAAALGQVGQPASSPTPPAAAVTPPQMRHFYGIDNINFGGLAGDGRGQTIAIVDAYDDPNALSDLQSFDSYDGLPNPPSFKQYNERGKLLQESGGTASPPPQDFPGPSSWAVEESLDIEWAHVIAPAANIALLEANSSGFSDLFTAVGFAPLLANVVSMSWGSSGEFSGESGNDITFSTPGVTFLAATGDGGSANTSYPAASGNVVAVGGTSIQFASGTTDGTYGSETAWSKTGGEISPYEPQPAYQNGVLSGSGRGTPDVSMDANPSTGVAIFDSFDFGTSSPWAQYGGTSLSTPMWAALVAIADQGRASAGLSKLDGKSQTLPGLYTLPASDFHDITSGSNGGYSATVGYDEVSGIGTPVANKLVNDLAGVAAAPAQAANTGAGITLSQSPDHLYIDWTSGASGGQILIGDTSGLTINGDGADDPIQLDYTNGNPLPLKLGLNGTFTINNLQGTNPLAGMTLDVGSGTVYINYSSSDPVATIRGYLQSGYNNGSWTGTPTASTGVITSSTARASSGYMIGYADSADGVISGQPANTIELKYTLGGDLNLAGTVNFADFAQVVANYGQPAEWDGGAITYGATVSFGDFSMIVRNYGRSAGGMTLPAAVAAPLATAATTGQNLLPSLPQTPPFPEGDNAPLRQPIRNKRHR